MRRNLPEYPWLDQTQCFDCAIMQSGWSTLIRQMLKEIDKALAQETSSLQVLQMKEKLGTLRFYYRLQGASSAQEAAIHEIYKANQDRSATICIECGEAAQIRARPGWIAPFCDRHAQQLPSSTATQ